MGQLGDSQRSRGRAGCVGLRCRCALCADENTLGSISPSIGPHANFLLNGPFQRHLNQAWLWSGYRNHSWLPPHKLWITTRAGLACELQHTPMIRTDLRFGIKPSRCRVAISVVPSNPSRKPVGGYLLMPWFCLGACGHDTDSERRDGMHLNSSLEGGRGSSTCLFVLERPLIRREHKKRLRWQ